MLENEYKNSLKAGIRYKGKDKERDNEKFEYSPLDEDAFMANTLNNLEDYTKDNFLPGDYEVGKDVTPEFLGGLDLTNPSLFEEEKDIEETSENFTAREDVIGAYLMLNQDLGSKLSMIAGVRLENTSLEYQGYKYDADENVAELSKGSMDQHFGKTKLFLSGSFQTNYCIRQ